MLLLAQFTPGMKSQGCLVIEINVIKLLYHRPTFVCLLLCLVETLCTNY